MRDERSTVVAGRAPSPDSGFFDAPSRFREFEEAAARFAREIRQRCEPLSLNTPTESAQLNVELARAVFGKWSIEILSVLYTLRSLGFEELRRQLGGITPRILSEKLKRLEYHGLVERRVESSRPPRVRYTLTEDGLTVAKLGEPVMLFLRLRRELPGPADRARAARGNGADDAVHAAARRAAPVARLGVE